MIVGRRSPLVSLLLVLIMSVTLLRLRWWKFAIGRGVRCCLCTMINIRRLKRRLRHWGRLLIRNNARLCYTKRVVRGLCFGRRLLTFRGGLHIIIVVRLKLKRR